MGLPSPQQLQELSKILEDEGFRAKTKTATFKGIMKSLAEVVAPALGQTGVQQGLSALSVGGGLPIGPTVVVGGMPVLAGTTLAPVSAALAPWIAAATVAVQAGKIFSLYDIKEDLQGANVGALKYSCNCGKCLSGINYILDKKERNVGIVAISVFTFGTVALGKVGHSVAKSVYSKVKQEERPKERNCRQLVVSARGGCTGAMAAIFLLSGSWTFIGQRDKKTMMAATATIAASDGWEVLKGNF